MTATLPSLEPVVHPGPPVSPRLIPVPTTSRSVWARLPAGRDLVGALDELLAGAGATSAQVELLSGSLSEVAYCHPAIGACADQPIWYSTPQDADGPVSLVGGAATVGFRDGARFVHAHAAWFDAHGAVRGGHLLSGTVVGASGLTVLAHVLDDATQFSADDPESRLPVFTPVQGRRGPTGEPSPGGRGDVPEGVTGGGTHRAAVVARVCPGENLLAACGRLMRAHGLRSARVAGSVGSLVGAALARPSGVLLIDGPATEVALTGHLRVDGAGGVDGALSAIVIDRHGRVHLGELLPENIVAVTVELFLEDAR